MKKLIYCAAALATALFVGSCQQELLDTPAGENTVTYTVEAPMDVQTKAIADGLNVDELIYEVWWTSADGTRDLTNAQRLYQAKTVMIPQEVDGKKVNKGTVTLNLVKDQHYTILFWAQVKGTDVYNTEHLTSVTYKNKSAKAYSANDDRLAAFYAVDFVNDGIARNSKVILKRPFAQVNLATLNERDPKNNTDEHPLDYSITLINSKMTLKQVPTKFNVATSVVSEPVDFEFAYHVVPSTEVAHTTSEGAEYYYAGMNYVFAGANLELTYDIQTRLNGSEQLATITNTIPNVPVKENYRTNIVGNLLTSKTDYEVIVDAAFNTNNKPGNIEVVGEGIVMNVDGDYEVTNSRGLAYAINNLFAEGGTFYVLNSIDMTGVEYNPSNIPAGVTVELVGQIPVVTRSAVEVEPITITGLEYGAIINNNDGSAIISNIAVSGSDEVADVPAFINVNNGTADITNCGASHQSFIGENNGDVTESHNTTSENTPIIKEDNGETLTKVGTADQLVAALEANKGVIFTNDIKIEPANMSNAYGKTGINVKNGQTIDGAGYTLNIKGAGETWDSGINTTGGLIKNITITGSFRGIFINHNSEHSKKVVLENVTIGDNGTVYTISCDQGLYQGIEATNCTFNGWTSFAATAGAAKFEDCSFGEGSGYAYCRPYSNTEFVNCTFGSGYAVDTTRATVTFSNCIWEVSTADHLVAALEAGRDVKFTNDIKIEPASMSNAYGTTGINVKNGQTIDGAGYTLNIKGAGGTWDSGINTTGGLIKNLTVTGSFRGIFINHNRDHSEKVILENVVITGTTYTISCDQGLNQNLEATDCEFYGWTSYAATIGNVKFTDCTFGAGNGYNFSRPYAPTQYVNCEFEAGHQIDPRAAVTFKNCTLNGVALTEESLATLVTGNTANAGVDTVVSTGDELVAALEAKKNVYFKNDIKIEPAKMSNAYGKTGVLVYNGQTIDGAGYKIDVKGAGGTWDSGICTSGGTIKNLWVTGGFRGIFVKGADHVEKVILDNVRVEGTTYTISIDQASSQGLEATNSIFRGWTSYAATIGNVKFTNCTFGAGNGYNFSRPYAPTEYVNCEFEAGHQIDPVGTVTFQNCIFNGEPLTAANIGTLVISDRGKYSNATLITAEGEVKFASTATELAKAVAAGQNVALVRDLTINNDEGITAPYGNKTALSQNGGVFNGNGKTITADLPGDNYVYMTNGGTTKNVNITGAFRGIMVMSATQTIYLDNVVSGGKGVVYAFNTGEGDSTQDLVATNCTFNGWSSWSLLKSATFTNCTFGQGSEYSNVYGRLLRPYVNTVFDGCDFCSKCYIDLSALVAKQMVTIKNCTVNGVKITADNWTSLVVPEDTCGEGQISVELNNGTFLTAENVADYIVFE